MPTALNWKSGFGIFGMESRSFLRSMLLNVHVLFVKGGDGRISEIDFFDLVGDIEGGDSFVGAEGVGHRR